MDRKLKLRKVKCLAQNHKPSKWLSWIRTQAVQLQTSCTWRLCQTASSIIENALKTSLVGNNMSSAQPYEPRMWHYNALKHIRGGYIILHFPSNHTWKTYIVTEEKEERQRTLHSCSEEWLIWWFVSFTLTSCSFYSSIITALLFLFIERWLIKWRIWMEFAQPL